MTFNFLSSPELCKKVVQGLWKTSNSLVVTKWLRWKTLVYLVFIDMQIAILFKRSSKVLLFFCTPKSLIRMYPLFSTRVMKDLALRRRKSLYFYTAFSREKLWFRNRIWLTWKCQVQNKWRQNIIKIIFDLFQLRIYRQPSRTSQSSKVSFSSSQKRGLCKL